MQDAIDPASPALPSNPAVSGQWSEVISLPNVPIHTHVLPSGKVLFWGRRDPAGTTDFDSLNQQKCVPFIWDPGTQVSRETSNQPSDGNGKAINLFCSGHTFLPDGRLMVTGGHLLDSQGIRYSTIYDPSTDTWTAGPVMNHGRWYPTAVTTADGRVFVCSGSFAQDPGPPPINNVPELWNGNAWVELADFLEDLQSIFPLYPRMHVAPDGRLFMSGALGQSFFFDPTTGNSTPAADRAAGFRDYAPSVMYDVGKVIFIGGGIEDGTLASIGLAEKIDLNDPVPVWRPAGSMHFVRRQHNATLLPDGTVLVTGGTQGPGFNNVEPGQPVHVAELWNPASDTFAQMAPESVDRCYHSTAVLLPDGRVFSGGGGEWAPKVGVANSPKDTHSDAQLFSPPYLFQGARPVITLAPGHVTYGQEFRVTTPTPEDIGQVTWIRLPSVTHSFDQNQRLNFLVFAVRSDGLAVSAPPNSNVCPPGHYMLFILNKGGVPSVASIVQIGAATGDLPAAPVLAEAPVPLEFKPSLAQKDAAIQIAEPLPPVVVGITPSCPYGLAACWGGAFEALKHLQGVRLVRPLPNAEESTAYVYLQDDGLPDIDLWPGQFANTAHGVYPFRGVEITATGEVKVTEDDSLILSSADSRPALLLKPIQAEDKIQWDIRTRALMPLTPSEQQAFQELQAQTRAAGNSVMFTVTGPLMKSDNELVLKVRKFS
jgi:galactose oxidase